MDDKIINGMDTQNVLDDTEVTFDKLVKKKRVWTGIAVFWFVVWLLIIMYMLFYGRLHKDTIKPVKSEPTLVATEEPDPVSESQAESIQVYEYNLRSVGLSEDFTDDLLVQGSGGYSFSHDYGSDTGTYTPLAGAYCVNNSAISAYDSKYSITWEIAKGDNNFTAERKNTDSDFITKEQSINTITGTTNLGIIYASVDNVKPLICISEEKVSRCVDGIAVILPSNVSDSEIQNGVSIFLGKVNDLGLKLNKMTSESCWSMDDKTIEDFKILLAESFSTDSYIISSTGNDDISVSGYDNDSIVVKSDKIKNGDKVVYITLQRFFLMDDMYGHTSAAYYSKYLQGDKSLEVFNDVNAFYSAFNSTFNK